MWRAKHIIKYPQNSSYIESKFDGSIAFLDTGVAYHPDLMEDNRMLVFKDFIHGNKQYYDDSGHGTHVCGIACGTGLASKGYYQGITPQSKFVIGKVLDKSGSGSVYHMLQGLEWIRANKQIYNIKVLNISIGINEVDDIQKAKELLEAIQMVCNEDILVVCAAGNNGPLEGSMSMIGNLEDVLIVGCHDGLKFASADCCDNYSARGNPYSRIKKPDIVAPGTHIMSCNKKCKKYGAFYHNAYTSKNGTSMATPMVSGAAMYYYGLHPEAPSLLVKQKILESAEDMLEPWTKQGKGMLNISKMIEE